MKIIVLAGGLSNERDVSLSSGSMVANALMDNGHKVYLLDLYKGVKEVHDNLFQDKYKYEYVVKNAEPNLEQVKLENNEREELIGENVIELCKLADIVFIALHGSIGENGKIQALFDIHNIKYTGSNYIGSAIAMNKSLAKELLAYNGIDVANGYHLTKGDKLKIEEGYPYVVKPCSNGSSIGVSLVRNQKELNDALENSFLYDEEVIVESFITGREFSVGVIGDEVLPPIEIIPKQGFYDYKNKYQAGLTEEICPANITDVENKLLCETAKKAFKALKLSNYARIDFILSDNKAYCLEANTLPGMTPTSLLPQEAQAIGMNYNELCEKIISLSIQE